MPHIAAAAEFAAALSGEQWQFVRVAQVDFNDLAGLTLEDVVRAFSRRLLASGGSGHSFHQGLPDGGNTQS